MLVGARYFLTHAFYLYAEPTPFAWYTITAMAPDGTLVTQQVHGQGGAAGYGLYTDETTDLVSLEIAASNKATEFAISEFGIYVEA